MEGSKVFDCQGIYTEYKLQNQMFFGDVTCIYGWLTTFPPSVLDDQVLIIN